MMDWRWIKALNNRLSYLKWAKEEGEVFYNNWATRMALPMFIHSLEHGETYYMDRVFCDLVEHARETIPDDIGWEVDWLQSPYGWMWIDRPVFVPDLEMYDDDVVPDLLKGQMGFSAIGWFPVEEGTKTSTLVAGNEGKIVGPDCTEFVVFQDFSIFNPKFTQGFGLWSYFLLSPGDRLLGRIKEFENLAASRQHKDHTAWEGKYPEGRESEKKHEIRWIYSAFHLMAQRLAMIIQHPHDRHTRKRLIKSQQEWPPWIKVVTLRRYQQHKKEAGKEDVDWQWQWHVRGHWRDQWYPSENVHKKIFIEAYIKGPEDKPLKPPGHTIFKATR